MARIARVVVPGLPHYIGASRCLSRPMTIALSPSDRDSGSPRRRRNLGLLPDAESYPSDRDADGRGWVAGDVSPGARTASLHDRGGGDLAGSPWAADRSTEVRPFAEK